MNTHLYSLKSFLFDATSFAHHLSSSVRLDGADTHFQVSPEIFDWVQVQALAGPHKDIHSVVYKPLLLCASGHCPVGRWTFCPAWGSECSGLGFHQGYLYILVHWAFLLLWRVPVAEKQAHSMRLLPAHFTFGMVLCRWWAELVPFKHKCLESGASCTHYFWGGTGWVVMWQHLCFILFFSFYPKHSQMHYLYHEISWLSPL